MRGFSKALALAASPILFFPSLAHTQPAPDREFRGVWIATVANLDWPNSSDSPREQKLDLMNRFDAMEDLNVNAVIFQVRSECDTMYESEIEPWSRYLTGAQGREPDPYWDPLAFAIEQAHRRGMELHAWINPYRAGVSRFRTFSSDHVSQNGSPFVVEEGNTYWLDPGHPQTIPYVISIVEDIVTRYDVDAIHIDDYFYPYSTPDFPDTATFISNNPMNLELDDWRRENTRKLIETMYNSIRNIDGKENVKFGVAPFGIYRPGEPPGIVGLDSYSSIYTDTRQWLREGWMDYFTPQIYWGRSADGYSTDQDFDALLDYWSDPEQNVFDRHIIPGLPTYKVGGDLTNPQHIINQIVETKSNPDADGVVHFRYDNIFASGVSNLLRNGVWSEPDSLPPASPWLDGTPPSAPTVFWTNGNSGIDLQIFKEDYADSHWILVQTLESGVWQWKVLPGWVEETTIPQAATEASIQIVDQSGNLSSAVSIDLTGQPTGLQSLEPWVVVEDFESPFNGTEAYFFQDPDFSGSSRNLVPDANQTFETNDSLISNADWNHRLDPRIDEPGSKSSHITFEFQTPGDGRVRLTTFQGTGNNPKPNPIIDFSKGLAFAIKLPKGTIDVTPLIRETNTEGPIGSDGGSTGPIEQVEPAVRLEGSAQWQRIYIDFSKVGYQSFANGNGYLDGEFGVLEGLLFTAVAGETRTEFEVYLDDFVQGPAVYPLPIGSPVIAPEADLLPTLDNWIVN